MCVNEQWLFVLFPLAIDLIVYSHSEFLHIQYLNEPKKIIIIKFSTPNICFLNYLFIQIGTLEYLNEKYLTHTQKKHNYFAGKKASIRQLNCSIVATVLLLGENWTTTFTAHGALVFTHNNCIKIEHQIHRITASNINSKRTTTETKKNQVWNSNIDQSQHSKIQKKPYIYPQTAARKSLLRVNTSWSRLCEREASK